MTIKLSEFQKKTQVSDSLHVAEVMQQILKRENKLGRSQEKSRSGNKNDP